MTESDDYKPVVILRGMSKFIPEESLKQLKGYFGRFTPSVHRSALPSRPFYLKPKTKPNKTYSVSIKPPDGTFLSLSPSIFALKFLIYL